MEKKWDEGKAIYTQIMERVSRSIASGVLKAGQKIPSVREYAAEFGVNPNTMQRALYELEREGLLTSDRNLGRFVTKDPQAIEKMQREQATAAFQEFYRQMSELGFSKEEIEDFFRESLKEQGSSAKVTA